ncbi:MAG: hypothetical protein V3T86_00360 [Planctomycetota bacterium]
MNDINERLEEYIDGLLNEEQCAEVEAALARDESLREEMARVRKFTSLLHKVGDPMQPPEQAVKRIVAAAEWAERRRRLMWQVTALAAAVLVAVTLGLMLQSETPPSPNEFAVAPPAKNVIGRVKSDWIAFGHRLGEIAAARRDGRVPRQGLAGFEIPPAKASGIVFKSALGALGIRASEDVENRAAQLVADHDEEALKLGNGIQDECVRSEAALTLYRKLRLIGGREMAEAYYDVFRPGIADPRTAVRVGAQQLESSIAAELGVDAAKRYVSAYADAVKQMERRYGSERVAVVLGRLAPDHARDRRRDATQDGVLADAVLSIRARLYRAACDIGAQRVYVVAP